MRVKLTAVLIIEVEEDGHRLTFGYGDVVDLPNDKAVDLIRSGQAVPDGLQYERSVVGPTEHREGLEA